MVPVLISGQQQSPAGLRSCLTQPCSSLIRVPFPLFISPLLDQWDPSLYPSTILNTVCSQNWGTDSERPQFEEYHTMTSVHSSVFVCSFVEYRLSSLMAAGLGRPRNSISSLSPWIVFVLLFFAIMFCLVRWRAVHSQKRQINEINKKKYPD